MSSVQSRLASESGNGLVARVQELAVYPGGSSCTTCCSAEVNSFAGASVVATPVSGCDVKAASWWPSVAAPIPTRTTSTAKAAQALIQPARCRRYSPSRIRFTGNTVVETGASETDIRDTVTCDIETTAPHPGDVSNVVYFETAFSSARAWSIWS